MTTRTLRNLCIVGAVLAIANFIAFVVGSSILGGDAVNGKQEAGRYYVCKHGRYTEVSKGAFTYSRFHAYSVWVTHPVGILCILLAGVNSAKRKQAVREPRGNG